MIDAAKCAGRQPRGTACAVLWTPSMWNIVLYTSSVQVNDQGETRETRKVPVIRPQDLLLAIEQQTRAAGSVFVSRTPTDGSVFVAREPEAFHPATNLCAIFAELARDGREVALVAGDRIDECLAEPVVVVEPERRVG